MLVIKKGSFSLPLATTLSMRSDTKKSADSAISPTGLRQPLILMVNLRQWRTLT